MGKSTRGHISKSPKQAPASRSKKLIVEFSGDLYARTQRAVADLKVSRSVLIRSAVEVYLENLTRRKLEQELAEGYIANAALDRRIAEEFAYSDSENI
jgi:metal-responsive CopG/Arc/MetJ family transcriptional regulator